MKVKYKLHYSISLTKFLKFVKFYYIEILKSSKIFPNFLAVLTYRYVIFWYPL